MSDDRRTRIARKRSHPATVEGVGESLEVVRGAELGVELSGICDPVAVVGVTICRTRALVILGDGADPDWEKRK